MPCITSVITDHSGGIYQTMKHEHFETETKKEDSIAMDTISTQNHSITRINRAKAIRMKCLDCCAYQPSEVRLCTSLDCPLWRYRMGKEERDSLYCRKPRNTSLIR